MIGFELLWAVLEYFELLWVLLPAWQGGILNIVLAYAYHSDINVLRDHKDLGLACHGAAGRLLPKGRAYPAGLS